MPGKGPLIEILQQLQKINTEKSSVGVPGKGGHRKPILIKIAPDLSNEQIDKIIDAVLITKIDGIIATNTTTSRENLLSTSAEIEQAGAGGLSGKPLAKRSTEIIRYIASRAEKRFHIIGVGGIYSANDAIEKLNAGADLIQIYSGFIYEGPGLIKKINKEIVQRSIP